MREVKAQVKVRLIDNVITDTSPSRQSDKTSLKTSLKSAFLKKVNLLKENDATSTTSSPNKKSKSNLK